VLVPVLAVSSVAMPLVEVIQVVAVADGVVPTSGPVLVIVVLVDSVSPAGALVPVTLMLRVGMAVVHVVNMVTVLHRGVPTIRAVHVWMTVMGEVLCRCAHGQTSP
jgi:hypothetical protein